VKCLYCGKPIKKWTAVVFVKRAPTQYDRPTTSIRYAYVGDQPPRTADDLVPYADGQKIVAVKYGSNGVHSFYTWDGKSYRPAFGHFCTNRCAGEFGRWAAEKGVQR
jgi:hypothetical protein